MNSPRVKHTMRDPKNNVTYHVMAYCQLSEEEVVASIRYYLARQRRKRREKNKIITIVTLFGM